MIEREIGTDDDGAVAPGSSFESVRFAGTRLQARDLAGCRFVDCVFDGANLSVARVPGVVLQGITFTGCKLSGIDWSPAARISVVTFEACVLDRCAFVGADLRRLAMRRCSAREAVFSETDLSEADLTRTDFTDASFARVKLAGADLRGATGYGMSPADNDLRKARVTLADAAGLLGALGIEVHP